MTIAPLSRLNQPQQAVVAANGSCVITFVPPPLGQQNTGTVTVWGSPHGVVWNVNLNNTVITSTIGNAGIGNIQQQDTDTLTLTATGLTPGLVVQATYVGVQENKSQGAVVAPDGSPIQSVNASAARFIGTFPLAAGPNTFKVNMLPTDRALLLAGSFTLPVSGSVVGATSGIDWGLGSNVRTTSFYVAFPCYGSIDSVVTITLNASGPSQVLVSALPDSIIEGTPSVPIAVTDSGVVQNVSTSFGASVTNGTAGIIGTPPAGTAWRISLMHLHCPTTAAGTTDCRIADTSGGALVLLKAYAGANGTVADSSANFTITTGLNLVSTIVGIAALATIMAESVSVV